MKTPILVFDLGSVLYEVDESKSLKQFQALSQKLLDLDAEAPFSKTLFKTFETGSMSEAAFRKEIRTLLGSEASDDEIDAAWNAMLCGVMNPRMADLVKLKKEYPLFLLSNTNSIHFRKLETECPGLFSLFERCFLSYEMGMRKPSVEIFKQTAKLGGFSTTDAWMIDDRKDNIEGAVLTGMKTFQVKNAADWQGLMKLLAPIHQNKF